MAAFGGGTPEAQAVRIFNAGRHPAAEIGVWYRDDSGAEATPRRRYSVLMPGEDAQLGFDIQPELVRKGQPPLTLRVAYRDGRGSHEVEPGMQAQQF